MQPSESTQFGTNGCALSYKWGTHCRTNGGCVSHPRRAHNLVQIIVCYNYHSAELRVRGLPKMALWYICTFGHWHICISSFPYCRTNGGHPLSTFGGRCHRCTFPPLLRPLSYRWGTHYRTDGGRCHRCTFPPLLRPLSYRWGMHCRTDGGCIVVQMGDAHYQHLGDAAIDALSRPSYAHYRTDGGRIVVQMGDALLPK